MRNQKMDTDQPISKPSFPLPMDFNPSKQREMPTQRRWNTSEMKNQRAHFYRKQSNPGGAPVYDFYITEDDRESH